MAGLNESRFALLKQLFRLAQQQRGALNDDQLQRFEALLDSRQRLLDRLAEGDAGPVPANVIPFPGRDGSPEDAIAFRALVQGILRIDQENEVLLRRKMAEVSGKLRRLNRGRQAQRGYTVPPQREAQLDRAS